MRPGTGRKSPAPIHPTVRSQEKIGGVGFCCATASMVHVPTRPATMLPASARSLKVNKDIGCFLLSPYLCSPGLGKTIWYRLRIMNRGADGIVHRRPMQVGASSDRSIVKGEPRG